MYENDDLIFSYGDITPVTPWGRALACFAAIYGISTVSMLVSVLVGRYQRVYSRKRFLNDDYSDEILFPDRCVTMTTDDQELEAPLDPIEVNDNVCERKETPMQTDKSEMHSSKVRFIIGYMSDDDDDDETDYDQDHNDQNGKELLRKIARNLLQSSTN